MPGAAAARVVGMEAARAKKAEMAMNPNSPAALTDEQRKHIEYVSEQKQRRKEANDTCLPESMQCLPLWEYQFQVRDFYQRTHTQIFVASLIGGNFLMNIIEATIDPKKEKYTDAFGMLEILFNIAFTIELLINMYAHWLKPFWKSGWNIFDFVVVSIGVLTMTPLELPGPLKLLRMMRAFRVFRLFKRIKSLKKIMDSLAKAVPGVINAFVILLLVMCIYSILAVEFWCTYGAGGSMTNEFGNSIELSTSRGQDYGYEYYGNFPKALYTMFQVMTGESWSEAVARPLMHTPDTMINVASGFYFVSFQILCATILINVVVAVLLEKMVDDTPAPEAQALDDEPSDEEDAATSPMPSAVDTTGATAAAPGAGAGADAGGSLRSAARERMVGSEDEDLMATSCTAANMQEPQETPPPQLPGSVWKPVEEAAKRRSTASSRGSRKEGQAPRRSGTDRVLRLQKDVAELKGDMAEIRGQMSELIALLSRPSLQ